jgi:hypothetical protein
MFNNGMQAYLQPSSVRCTEMGTKTDYATRLAHAMQRRQPAVETAELANAVGLTRQAVHMLLAGNSKALSVAPHARAARFLDVDPFWLATGEGTPDGETVAVYSALALDIAAMIDAMPEAHTRQQAWAVNARMAQHGQMPAFADDAPPQPAKRAPAPGPTPSLRRRW